MPPPETLLQAVADRQTFLAFLEALAHDREGAETAERDAPDRYRLDGAYGWKNAELSAFLYVLLNHFRKQREDSPPSWKGFADALYAGKVLE